MATHTERPAVDAPAVDAPAATSRPAERRRLVATVAGCALLLVAAVVTSVLVGSVSISPAAVLDTGDPQHYLVEARLPRTLLALAVGAALGLAGATIQGLTRNPLADPGLLGVNAGASLAMVLAMSVLGWSDLSQYLWCAFAGAAVAAVLVHAVAGLGADGATPVKLTIAGAAVTAGLTSWTSALLLADRHTMETFRFWQVGTVGGRGYDELLTGLPFLAVGAALALAGTRVLDALALGDDLAAGLGRRTGPDRLLVGLAVVLLAGGATALAGPIAFVGLVVPHAARLLTGPAHGRVLPLSAVLGAVLVVTADVAGRVVLPPTEVQVGITAAVAGVPAFVVLLRRGRLGSL